MAVAPYDVVAVSHARRQPLPTLPRASMMFRSTTVQTRKLMSSGPDGARQLTLSSAGLRQKGQAIPRAAVRSDPSVDDQILAEVGPHDGCPDDRLVARRLDGRAPVLRLA